MTNATGKETAPGAIQFYRAPVSNVHSDRTMTLAEVYNYITTDYGVLQATQAYRQALLRVLRGETDRSKARALKARTFDSATFSGTFRSRRDECLVRHSGLLCLDFDHVGDRQRLDTLKQRLAADRTLGVRLLFTSPSGDGLKLVAAIDTARAPHRRWFCAMAAYAKATYGIEADSQCANVSRCCFLPHDAACYYDGSGGTDSAAAFDLDRWAPEGGTAQPSATPPAEAYADSRDAQRHDSPSNADSLLAEAEAAARRITELGTDITQGYQQWLTLGFALADGLGEQGRTLFHSLSRMNPGYDTAECDRQYSACLKSHKGGVTIRSFFNMAKEAGVDLGEVRKEVSANSANSAKVRLGTNYEKTAKNGKIAVSAQKRTYGTMALVALTALTQHNNSSGYTFSDKLRREDLPEILHPVFDTHADSVSRDKMILGTLNVVSGLIGGASGPHGGHPCGIYGIYDRRRVYATFYNIVYGTAGSSKGDMAFCKLIARPVKNEMRRQYEAAKAQYDRDLAAYEAEAKGKGRKGAERGPAPEEPPYRDPFVPGNSSSSAVYRAIDANGGWGMMFETEADTISAMLDSDYGNYSELMRKAFHHEPVTMNRVSERLHIDLEEPRLSVLLTCTPGQLLKLFPSFENGLGSRFLFYALPDSGAEFHDVFATGSQPYEDVYRRLGDQVLPLYHALQARTERPVQFVLSEAQQKEFVGNYSAILAERMQLSGADIKAFVYRLALSGFRYAMVLAALRRLSERTAQGGTSEEAAPMLFRDDENALLCDDRDFATAIAITNCLVNHTACVFAVLANDKGNPFATQGLRLKQEELDLFNALPDGEIQTPEIVQIAGNIKIPRRSAFRIINRLSSVYKILVPLKRGVYRKASPQGGADGGTRQTGTLQ